MPTINPSQSYENILTPVKGFVPNYALDYTAPAADGESFEAGSLVSLNSDGEIIAGCADDAMPMFSINGTDDFDNRGDTGNIAGAGIGALVATGGFEVYTTAYDTAETYTPNTFLTAATGSDAGKVTVSPTSYNDRVICGCVSRGEPSDTQYDQDLLYFWTMFIPKTEVSGS